LHGLGNPLAQLCAVLHFPAANDPRAKAVQCSEPVWCGHIELSAKPAELLRTGAGPAFARTVLKRSRGVPVVRKIDIVHIGPPQRERRMDELNGKLIACQILITGLIARVANEQRDPLRFLTDFRDEIKAVVKGVNIAGMDNSDRVRAIAQQTVDELFSLMKPPSSD